MKLINHSNLIGRIGLDWIENKPCYEENLALLTVVGSDEIEVVNSISTIVFGESSGEVIISLRRTPGFLDDDNVFLFVDLEDDEAVNFLPLQIEKRALASIVDTHP